MNYFPGLPAGKGALVDGIKHLYKRAYLNICHSRHVPREDSLRSVAGFADPPETNCLCAPSDYNPDVKIIEMLAVFFLSFISNPAFAVRRF